MAKNFMAKNVMTMCWKSNQIVYCSSVLLPKKDHDTSMVGIFACQQYLVLCLQRIFAVRIWNLAYFKIFPRIFCVKSFLNIKIQQIFLFTTIQEVLKTLKFPLNKYYKSVVFTIYSCINLKLTLSQNPKKDNVSIFVTITFFHSSVPTDGVYCSICHFSHLLADKVFWRSTFPSEFFGLMELFWVLALTRLHSTNLNKSHYKSLPSFHFLFCDSA